MPATVKTNVLEGNNFAETFTKFVHRNKPDVILLFNKKQNSIESKFKDDAATKIVKHINVPLLVCFRK
jgi:ABC-type sulfate transport system substrate-binding protein